MGLTPKFTQADVRSRFDRFLAVVERRQIQRLQYLGEMCVTHARSIPASAGFTDQTGNLRSSIGYAVFKNGVAVHEGFSQVLQGSEGAKKGKELAWRVGEKYKDGIALVVTAGMNYAVAVESRGKDVITSAEILAKNELPRMLKELTRNINQAFNDLAA